MKNPIICTVVTFAVLAGCSTRYREESRFSTGGYSSKEIESGVYELRYSDTGITNYADMLRLWKRRATELCQPDGYDARPEDTSTDGMILSGQFLVPVKYLSVKGAVFCKRAGTPTISIERQDFCLERNVTYNSYFDFFNAGRLRFENGNYEDAIQCFTFAANAFEYAHREAMTYLSDMYRSGLGVEQDTGKSEYWRLRATGNLKNR